MITEEQLIRQIRSAVDQYMETFVSNGREPSSEMVHTLNGALIAMMLAYLMPLMLNSQPEKAKAKVKQAIEGFSESLVVSFRSTCKVNGIPDPYDEKSHNELLVEELLEQSDG